VGSITWARIVRWFHGFRAVPDNQPPQDEELSPFKLIERVVDTAMQAHGIWTPEVSATIGQIVKVAEELSDETLAHDENYLRYGMVNYKKLRGVDPKVVFRALAIYKQALADLCGMDIKQVEAEIRKYQVK